MAEDLIKTFIEALQELERSGDVQPMVALYADACELGNAAFDQQFLGKQGAEQFWRHYRGSFRQIESRFRSVIPASGRAALEWVSRGIDRDGHDFAYEGVSILEFGDGGISRFYAYFDRDALQGSELGEGAQQQQ